LLVRVAGGGPTTEVQVMGRLHGHVLEVVEVDQGDQVPVRPTGIESNAPEWPKLG
jgi:hypothetical protein